MFSNYFGSKNNNVLINTVLLTIMLLKFLAVLYMWDNKFKIGCIAGR